MKKKEPSKGGKDWQLSPYPSLELKLETKVLSIVELRNEEGNEKDLAK